MIEAFDGPLPVPYGCGTGILLVADEVTTPPTDGAGARAPESAIGAEDFDVAGKGGDVPADDDFNAGDDFAPLAAARPFPRVLGLASPLGPASAPPVGSATAWTRSSRKSYWRFWETRRFLKGGVLQCGVFRVISL